MENSKENESSMNALVFQYYCELHPKAQGLVTADTHMLMSYVGILICTSLYFKVVKTVIQGVFYTLLLKKVGKKQIYKLIITVLKILTV